MNTESIPDIAIKWTILHSCSSNVELAIVSNVSRSWRITCSHVLRDLLDKASFLLERDLVVEQTKSPSVARSLQRDIGHFNHDSIYKHLSTLLLPDMVLELIRRYYFRKYKSQFFQDELCQINLSDLSLSPQFCLSWFAPSGIQTKMVNLDSSAGEEEEEDVDYYDFSSPPPSTIMNHYHYEPPDELNHSKNNNNQSRKCLSTATRNKICNFSTQSSRNGSSNNKQKSSITHLKQMCYEWRSYKSPIDILTPFGYDVVFIENVLKIALNIVKAESTSNLGDNHHGECKYSNTNFAVRGATIARPDGFCLCWDADDIIQTNQHSTSSVDFDKSNPKHDELVRKQMYKLEAFEKQRFMRRKKRNNKMKDCLPRVQMSALCKNSCLDDVNCPDDDMQLTIQSKRRQRCVQFLNANGDRAVFMRTPPFDCGNVQSPITIFCVGIATEDGCFVSGLSTKFELGHMYGIDPIDSLVGMSPICINAQSSSPLMNDTTKILKQKELLQSDISFYDSDTSNERDQRESQGEVHCQCIFNDRNDYYESDEEMVDTNMNDDEHITRGRMGPGQWHCYTAIFDGESSVIRVDGRMETSPSLQESSRGEFDHRRQMEIIAHCASLDGLTIGSDHLFDMSLCYGEGCDGEGEGSISELVVFKGRLHDNDIAQIEHFLMEKHGIVHGSLCDQVGMMTNNGASNGNKLTKSKYSHIHDPWQEDLWRRQAEALITQPPQFEIKNTPPIPLRTVAKHRSVAWNQRNVVTGNNIQVSRIGAKKSNGSSSDW